MEICSERRENCPDKELRSDLRLALSIDRTAAQWTRQVDHTFAPTVAGFGVNSATAPPTTSLQHENPAFGSPNMLFSPDGTALAGFRAVAGQFVELFIEAVGLESELQFCQSPEFGLVTFDAYSQEIPLEFSGNPVEVRAAIAGIAISNGNSPDTGRGLWQTGKMLQRSSSVTADSLAQDLVHTLLFSSRATSEVAATHDRWRGTLDNQTNHLHTIVATNSGNTDGIATDRAMQSRRMDDLLGNWDDRADEFWDLVLVVDLGFFWGTVSLKRFAPTHAVWYTLVPTRMLVGALSDADWCLQSDGFSTSESRFQACACTTTPTTTGTTTGTTTVSSTATTTATSTVTTTATTTTATSTGSTTLTTSASTTPTSTATSTMTTTPMCPAGKRSDRMCEQYEPFDLVFVLDASLRSTSYFTDMVDFVATFVENVPLGGPFGRVGLIVAADDVFMRLGLHFDHCSHASQFLRCLAHAVHKGLRTAPYLSGDDWCFVIRFFARFTSSGRSRVRSPEVHRRRRDPATPLRDQSRHHWNPDGRTVSTDVWPTFASRIQSRPLVASLASTALVRAWGMSACTASLTRRATVFLLLLR